MSESARTLLRRYLAQRRELGEVEVVLDAVAARDVRRLLSPRPAPAPAAPRERRPPAVAPAPAQAPRPEPLTAPLLPAVDAELIRALPTLDALRATAAGCPRCRLAGTRQSVVFGEGAADAQLLVVGEAPGADEDRTGRPFVGRAGKMLDLLLAATGFVRDEVFICNVVKCRPPGNRNPQPQEVEACSPYLVRQVELVRPRVILALGNVAAQALLGTNASIGNLRGGAVNHRFRDIPVVPTYHPAALLRHPGWVQAVWADLQRVRDVLEPA